MTGRETAARTGAEQARELGYERRFRLWAQREQIRIQRVAYWRAGGETTAFRLIPPGRPRAMVVVCHGAGNDAMFGFVGLFTELLTNGYEIFTFDLDGHGRFSTTRWRADEAPAAIAHAVEQSGVRQQGLPLHLLGISLGGSLLIHALRDLPATSAVVIASPLRISVSPRTILREVGWRSIRALWRERRYYGLFGLVPAFGPFKRSLYPVRLSGPDGRFGYIRELNDTLLDLDLERAAAGATAPVLLLYGERDLTAPPKHGRVLREALRNGELQVLPSGTHLTTPVAEETIRSVLGWFQLHDRPPREAPPSNESERGQ
jgi:alpha-beta hydrolase superfamily lysophospholipase